MPKNNSRYKKKGQALKGPALIHFSAANPALGAITPKKLFLIAAVKPAA